MGFLKDIFDFFKDGKQVISDIQNDTFNLSTRQKSLTRRASEGTLQFPVIVTRALDSEVAQMIAKSLETNFASFVQIAFSMSPIVKAGKNTSGVEFIKQFHQNMGTNTGFGIRDLGNLISKESFEPIDISYDDGTIQILGRVCEGTTPYVVKSHKDGLWCFEDYIVKEKLNDKFIPKPLKYLPLRSQTFEEYKNANKQEPLIEDQDPINYMYSTDTKNAKSGPPGNASIMKDMDVKKINDLIPTTLHVRIKLLDNNNSDAGHMDFVVGVKALMHPVSSEEMVTNVSAACNNNGKVFNFIKWTTGEISFFKDFLFRVKDAKNDAINTGQGSSGWWTALKRRRALAKIKDTFFMSRILPNATIVITMEEAEQIRMTQGYDLMNTMFVNKVMSTYFLLAFVIVDTSAQIAHLMFDGQQHFNSVTFSGLERENSKAERKYKEMLKATNRF